jgi:DNA-binding MarR family transcriptional regulator
MKNAWLELRKFARDTFDQTDLNRLDHLSHRLLEWILEHQNPEQPLYIQTLVMRAEIASPASVYKCIDTLLREGFISVEVDGSDARRRIVSATESTKKLMAALSKRTNTWLKAQLSET